MTRQIVEPLVRRAALTQSFNDAWQLIAGLFLLSLLAVPLIRKTHLKPSAMGPGTTHLGHSCPEIPAQWPPPPARNHITH